MLQKHIQQCEKCLLSLYEIAGTSGHVVNQGDSREMFVNQFLRSHLPESAAIGRGEVFDCHSKPKERRNQIDLVIYRRDFPRIDFGGGNNGFLIESVNATIEVKSTLRRKDVEQAVDAAWKIKHLNRTGRPSYLFCGLLAYRTSAKKLSTVVKWLDKAEKKYHIKTHSDPHINNGHTSPTIDSVVVLGKGVIHCYNPNVGLNPKGCKNGYRWLYTTTRGCHNLLLFFLQVMFSCQCVRENMIRYLSYVRNTSVFKNITVVP